MAGPVLAGYIVECAGYRVMWRVMILPIAAAFVLLICFSGKITKAEADFKKREQQG